MANISNQRMLDILINLKDKAIEVAAINSVTLATNEYVANMKNRVFKDGKNTNNEKIGDYKKGRYRNKRAEKGRQVDYVDLKNEGSLQFSIQSDENKVGYTSAKEAKKGGGLQFGNKNIKGYGIVFQPSKSEKEKHTENTSAYYTNELKKLANDK